jgi:hypothetical protein
VIKISGVNDIGVYYTLEVANNDIVGFDRALQSITHVEQAEPLAPQFRYTPWGRRQRVPWALEELPQWQLWKFYKLGYIAEWKLYQVLANQVRNK